VEKRRRGRRNEEEEVRRGLRGGGCGSLMKREKRGSCPIKSLFNSRQSNQSKEGQIRIGKKPRKYLGWHPFSRSQ
jgi:hypothetical protein